ncbi:MAG: hypothetical protein IKL76_01360 [Clostridia bacterium]|nr:hypothetical protein [Clostridia bacterium]
MIIVYILLVAYILAINFYAFLLVKSFRDKERESELRRESAPLSDTASQPPQNERFLGKLLITGALGGALTVYICMFIFKFRRSDLLLMVLMPLLGVLNVYLFVILFRSGFLFFRVR